MANTYTQLLVQFVFAVQNRDALIHESIRERLEKYITGIISKNNHKPLAIYCMPDHCHILVGLHPTQSISGLAKDIKSNSAKWLNKEHLLPNNFNWQEGFGAFSYSRSQLDTVVKYILKQPEHHTQKSFKDEYEEFLLKFDVPYDKQYIFEILD